MGIGQWVGLLTALPGDIKAVQAAAEVLIPLLERDAAALKADTAKAFQDLKTAYESLKAKL